MLRNRNLIPLSHQHQRVLALCVRIDRAASAESEIAAWQAEMAQLFRNEVEVHFAAEEQIVFPAALQFEELAPLVGELTTEHGVLRSAFEKAEAGQMRGADLAEFTQRMSSHVRKEERQLFEGMQQRMSADELDRLGKQLEEALAKATQVCSLRTQAGKQTERGPA